MMMSVGQDTGSGLDGIALISDVYGYDYVCAYCNCT